jgi:H+/Cl- antiporter ClcA
MALYGSKAIRGHGIPEAMEQILTNQSRIKPSITFLKPLSAAISIGTGGPFGAEGPIISTGGALGSTIGQLLKITNNERKILLAAGATAGMSAIFGSPIAAIFLAIELLLFEFSPRSILPVALACITGAAGHHLLFEAGPVFPMPFVKIPDNSALGWYCLMGIIIGLLSTVVTKCVYLIEDSFEKLPIHWMWWPALGGIVVGVVGYFAPQTLGVGYENIIAIISGTMSVQIILSLSLLKFVSWAIALGSGTSGGTLAPLLTIGGATGSLLGIVVIQFFPDCGIFLPLAGLVGMAAMFAGASRALLTSIVFALETSSQPNALIPLLGACTASYFVSFFLMKNSIMTEKIARRGIITPHSYEPDILEKITVKEVMKDINMVLDESTSIEDARGLFSDGNNAEDSYFIIINKENNIKGISNGLQLHNLRIDSKQTLTNLTNQKPVRVISSDRSLKFVVEMMSKENVEVLPVVFNEDKNTISGIISYKEIIGAYKHKLEDHIKNKATISINQSQLIKKSRFINKFKL